uniref:Myelin protein zero-like protein 1 n=1 Tax=Sinocyclocheilus rhinocerous TaxID=307959 RepID=A0A673GZW2_9TELE
MFYCVSPRCLCTLVSFICVSGVSAIDVYTPAELFAENGTTATLSCSFKSREVISSLASVVWSFLPEGETGIFYYSGGKQFPGSVPQFKSRVEWAGDMNKKDVSIRVLQMQFKDNGTFSCDVKNPPDISRQMSFTKVRVVMKGERHHRKHPATYICNFGPLRLILRIYMNMTFKLFYYYCCY